MKFLMNLGLAVFVAVLISSCVDLDSPEPERKQTKAEEMSILSAYIDSLEAKDYNVDTTAMGVYYVVIDEGEGAYPKQGDTVVIGYSGYLMDGYLFDSSEIHWSDGKWEFEIGAVNAIPGWEDGIKQINEGGKIQFIVPSELGYGPLGSGIIGPNQSLIFVVKMFEIKPSSEV